MLIPNHPHDERLAALASADPDAVADTRLRSHVSSCNRCAALVQTHCGSPPESTPRTGDYRDAPGKISVLHR